MYVKQEFPNMKGYRREGLANSRNIDGRVKKVPRDKKYLTGQIGG